MEKYPLNGVSHLCSILPIFIGTLNYKYLTKGLRLLLILFGAYFISDSYSLLLSIYHRSTFAVQNIQPLWEVMLIATLYLNYFQSALLKKTVLYGTAIIVGVIILTFRTDSISPVSSTVQKLFVTALALMYLNEIMDEIRITNILIHSMFWMSAGVLIYSAGTFFFSLFSTYLYADITSDNVFDAFWNLSQLLYILFVLLATVGLWFSKYDRTNLI